MRVIFVSILLAAVAASLWSIMPASAETVAPGKEGELLKFLPPEPGKRICFSRVYSAEHLAKHPRQKVTSIEFRLAYHRFEPEEFYPEGQRNYYFEVLAKLRGLNKQLSTIGECSPANGFISCMVDCDGGGILAKRTAKPGQILLSFGDYWGLRMTDGCDAEEEGEGYELKPGEDDKEFLLTETSACPAYDDW